MDIKDVNSANPLLFSKTAAINNAAAALGNGFANLLGQTTQAFAGNRNEAVDVSPKAEKNVAKENAEDVRAPRREDKEKGKNVKETAKEKAPKQTKTKKAENADVPAGRNNDVPAMQTETKPEVNAEVGVAAEQVQPEMATEETASVVVENIVETAAENVVPQTMIEDEAANGKAVDQAAAPAENIKNGEKVVVLEAVVADEEVSEAEALFTEAAAVPEGEEVVVVAENEKSVKGDKKNVAESVVSVDEGEVVDSLAKEQSIRLSEKIENKQQLKISVDVKEEKIAYQTSQDTFKSRMAIDEAVKAASAESADETPAKGITSAANTDAQPQMQTSAAGAYTAPMQNLNVPVAETISAARSVEIASVSTQSGQTAHVMSGSEFVAAAKTEAAGKENAPSFKEVYKGMSKEAVDQVKVNITKSAVKGVDKIDVQLKPEELGRIEIKMQIGKDGKLQAHIIASRPETVEMLQKEVQSLEKAFNDAGFQTDEGSLSFSFRDDGQSGRNQDNGSELRSFIGNVFEQEANNELLAANSDIQGWISDKGLNIRV